MAYRKIHIGDEIWQYTVGRSNVHIKGPNNESFNCPKEKLATRIECGCWPYSCYDVAGVQPKEIKKYITEQKK